MIMLAGMFSSILLATLTYPAFFLVVCLCTLPGMLTLFFIPLQDPRPPTTIPAAR